MAFAIYDPFNFEPVRVRILDPNERELLWFEIQLEKNAAADDMESPDATGSYFVQRAYPIWLLIVYPVPDVPALIRQPGQYKVVVSGDDEDIPLGCLQIGFAPAPPLTEDRIAAIRSDPHAAKWVRFVLKCNECGDEIVAYTGLEPSEEQEQTGAIWCGELPDTFKCECGKSEIDLTFLRSNLHAFLGQTVRYNEEALPFTSLSFTRLYEESALELCCSRFETLLNRKPSEGEILQFIRDNPVLLHRFSPARVFYEVPILTKYRSDVVVHMSNSDLLLVELEKPQTRLMKKDGGMASPMRHALDQVRDWLHLAEDHKLAVLDCIGLRPEDVSAVRGAVVLGRDGDYPPEHLRRLRWEDYGRTAFYTYDDLLRDLTLLRMDVKEL